MAQEHIELKLGNNLHITIRTPESGEMFASWIAHDNLHLRQLVEFRRKRIENITKPYPIGYAGDW